MSQFSALSFPLLQRLTGSYAAMEGGLVKEALVDFTGGIGETHKLKIPNPELFQIIQAAVNKCSLMGASIKVGIRKGCCVCVLKRSCTGYGRQGVEPSFLTILALSFEKRSSV